MNKECVGAVPRELNPTVYRTEDRSLQTDLSTVPKYRACIVGSMYLLVSNGNNNEG